ncbi:MAG TPA: RHS repeat-associated core domain-containing protein [Smithellaceae bacterium]|nr:RHS repeat-associated core domain-containing protein [Smithellaceae bacterium]HRS89552.1 RHS repeat-associated core domain-containing protein [Smithellaceae bacterium]HRV26502.1 RHS repeat-associated core domain-containing protein [Smithellaceae bacterium]
MGNVVQKYEYDSFGNMQPTHRWIKQPYTYTAREFDPETGLYYYRARYYDAKAGRFITRDPIGFDGGDVNLYAYVGNNPVNLKDPFGFKSCSDCESFLNNCYLLASIATGTTTIVCSTVCVAILKAPYLCRFLCATGGAIVGQELYLKCHQYYKNCKKDCNDEKCEK